MSVRKCQNARAIRKDRIIVSFGFGAGVGGVQCMEEREVVLVAVLPVFTWWTSRWRKGSWG